MHFLPPRSIEDATASGERCFNRLARILPGISTALLLIGATSFLAGCAPGKYTYYVHDGGVASYYTYTPIHPEGRVVSVWDADEGYRPARRHYRHRRVSTPVDQTTLDAHIPHDYAKLVSSRGPTKWTDIRRMCRESRPGYCDKPNVGHCHGPFCHAHPGGDVKHTH